MRKALKIIPLIILVSVFASCSFLLCSCTLFDNNLYGVYKFEYMMFGNYKVKSGELGMTEDDYVLVFREDGSFTFIENTPGVDEPIKNGTWVKNDDNTYSFIFGDDAGINEDLFRTVVFKNGRCRLFTDEGKEFIVFKYYGTEEELTQ